MHFTAFYVRPQYIISSFGLLLGFPNEYSEKKKKIHSVYLSLPESELARPLLQNCIFIN